MHAAAKTSLPHNGPEKQAQLKTPDLWYRDNVCISRNGETQKHARHRTTVLFPSFDLVESLQLFSKEKLSGKQVWTLLHLPTVLKDEHYLFRKWQLEISHSSKVPL